MRTRSRVLIWCIAVLLTAPALLVGVAAVLVDVHYGSTLPELEHLPAIGPARGHFASYDDIPRVVIDAFLAAEDPGFFEHPGLSLTTIVQSVWLKLRQPRTRLGGSTTLTAQAARMLLDAHDAAAGDQARRPFGLRWALLTHRLDRYLGNEGSLLLYLDNVYLGSGTHGVIDAAQHYFHKTPRELTLAEAATLAGVPRRPSDYSPAVDSAAAQARRNHVLAAMLAAGTIGQTAHDDAVAETVTVFAD